MGNTASVASTAVFEDTPPLNANDFPEVKYWYKKHYSKENTKRRKSASVDRANNRAALDESISFWFLYNADGTPVNIDIVTSLRADAKLIWASMCEDYGPMGLPWSDVLVKHRFEFWLRLEYLYPFLRLCANHYKADAVATCDYTHWYNNHIRKRRRETKPARAQKSPRGNGSSRWSTRLCIEDEDDDDEVEVVEHVADDQQLSEDDNENVEQDNEDGSDEDGEVGDDEDRAVGEEAGADGDRDAVPFPFANSRDASRASLAYSHQDEFPLAKDSDDVSDPGIVRISLFE